MTGELPLPRALRGSALRWGILGPGRIAHDFAVALQRHTDQLLVAVASRSLDRALDFAARHGIPHVHPDYESLVAAPGVDVVYVATPTSEHRRVAALALEAGKAVLVEKPLAGSVADARAMQDDAAARGGFLMEAMWTRFLPQTGFLLDVLSREPTTPLQIAATFGESIPREGRVFRSELGGGALRDLGVYPIWLSRLLLGEIELVDAAGAVDASAGVDTHARIRLAGAGGRATVETSIVHQLENRARIRGANSAVELGPLFVAPGYVRIVRDGRSEVFEDRSGLAGRDGLAWQAVALAQDVVAGRHESRDHPLAVSIAVLALIDAARGEFAKGAAGE